MECLFQLQNVFNKMTVRILFLFQIYFFAGVSCGLFVVAFAWGVITSDTSVFVEISAGNLRQFICDRIADRGAKLIDDMKVKDCCYEKKN